MARIRPVVAALVVLLVVLGGSSLGACSRKGRSANLPAGDALIRDSAAAMREVKTVRFAIEADGTVAGLPLRRAGGQLTKEGSAKGTAQLEQFGTPIELEFVVIGESIHIKGLTGGWQTLPLAMASGVYDPSAILDPDRGIVKVLETATGAKTEAREKVGDVDTYRVAATFDGASLRTIVPGAADSTPGQVWIGVDRKQLHRARFTIPGDNGAEGATVTVTFTEYDAPVTISAP